MTSCRKEEYHFAKHGVGRTLQQYTDDAARYGLADLAFRGGVGALATPIPKAWFGVPTVMGASRNTNLLSYFGFANPAIDYRISTRILGTTRVFGIAGRAMPFIGTGIMVYDAGAISMCTYNCMQSRR